MLFTYNRVIRFQDTDAAGVVYFANILSICHEAYEAWLAAIGINLKEFFSGKTVAVPIVHAEADFCNRCFVARLTRFTSPHPAERQQVQNCLRYLALKQRPTCQPGVTVHVCIDPQSRSRTSLPAEILQQLEKHEE